MAASVVAGEAVVYRWLVNGRDPRRAHTLTGGPATIRRVRQQVQALVLTPNLDPLSAGPA